MKVTSIKQQVKRADRYSVFVDGKYSFSLSESALLESKLASGLELSSKEVENLKKLSNEDKLYNQTLRYAALRPRTEWEVSFYLERKDASPALIPIILNKLSIIGLIDDKRYAESFINDRRLLRPSSRRKIIMDLKRKRVSEEVIRAALEGTESDEDAALRSVINKKRQQSKYQDNVKLMQYLARQGFNYDDIKRVLAET